MEMAEDQGKDRKENSIISELEPGLLPSHSWELAFYFLLFSYGGYLAWFYDQTDLGKYADCSLKYLWEFTNILPCSLQHYSQQPNIKQFKCPPIDEWIRNMHYVRVYMYGILFSQKKKKEILPFATIQVDLEGIY